MTPNEIIAMAREAGFRAGRINLSNGHPVPFIAPASGTSCMVELERFAALVAAKEREACAVLVESEWSTDSEKTYGDELASFIRARGAA